MWHVEAEGCAKAGTLYGLRAFGEGGWDTPHRWDADKVVLDPYAPLISGRRHFGVRDEIEAFVPEVRARLHACAVGRRRDQIEAFVPAARARCSHALLHAFVAGRRPAVCALRKRRVEPKGIRVVAAARVLDIARLSLTSRSPTSLGAR